MAPIIDQIMRLFATPQGTLMYSVVLGLTAFGALQACSYAGGRKLSLEAKRMQQGLLFLFLTQILLFIAAWMAWLGVIDDHIILPPLDRTLALFSLVLIICLWAFPKPKSVMDGFTAVLESVIVLTGVISMLWWLRQNPGAYFNTSMPGAYAYYSGLVLLAVGLILLLWRRPSGWGYGSIMLFILLGGYLAQYFIRQAAGDYAWLVRLGEMIAFPLLLALPRRLASLSEAIESTSGEKISPLATSAMDTEYIRSIVDISTETSAQQYYQKLTRLVAQLMDADICILMIPPKTGEQIIVPVGYSQLDNGVIDGFTADGHKMPVLLSALQTGKTLRLDGGSADSEVNTLKSEFGLKQNAHLLVVPFNPRVSSPEMGISVLSKPSHPIWSEKDELQLVEVAKVLASIAGQLDKKTSPPANQEEYLQALQRAQADSEKLRQEYTQLKTEYDAMSSQATQVASMAGSTAILVESQKSLQDMVKQLETRNRELETLLTTRRPSIEEAEQLRQELRAALADLARIPSTLSKSDQKMLELQLSAMKRLDDMGQTELVTSIAQDFRQPLSSIIGYTDLMLGETVGILGAMQRKFLERVKASSERLGLLMNELVQVLAIDGGKLDQTPAKVDLEAVIDEAVGNIIAQISEKNITMRVDLPEKLPSLRANKDAVQQILANLLQNACLVTPADGEIRLSAKVERKEDEPNYMHISVMDQGGGITREDIPRVFSRRYKVENPLIQGIGDTGVGLSIVKSLVELLKGRVWVDTQEGIGSTFSVLFPLIEEPTGQIEPAISPPG